MNRAAPSGQRPPWLGRLALRVFVPESIRRDVEGDLQESFEQLVQDGRLLQARLHYLREAFSPSLLGLRRAVRGMDLAPGASPIRKSGDPLMSSLFRDLKYAFRTLGRAPGFAAVVVLSLALGIGPNTAVFSVVNGLFFADRGIVNPERVVEIYSLSRDGRHSQTYWGIYERVLEGTTDVFDDVSAMTTAVVRLESETGPVPALAELVTDNFFDVLEVNAAYGRTFLPEEGVTPGTHPVVVISDRLFHTRYNGDASVVGQTIRVNGRPYTIVGVIGPEFKGKILPGIEVEMWLPMMMYPHLAPAQMTQGNLQMSARVRDGIEPGTAVAAVETLGARINEERGDSRSTFRLGPYVYADYYFSPSFDGILKAMAALLLSVVGLVLLVACVNLAGFFLARATDRRREMAVRSSMGAGRQALLRQLLVESLLLAAIGGLLGLGLGILVVEVVTGVESPLPIPITFEPELDLRVLGFTALVTVMAGVLFGLTPALRASSAPVAAVLRDESASVGGGKGKDRIRRWLVTGQMALSMMLLVGAGLFLRSLQSAMAVDTGFDTGPAAMVHLDMAAYEPDERRGLLRQMEAAILADTDVQSVGITNRLPLALGNTNRAFDIPGAPLPENSDFHLLELNYASPGYFETMGIEVVQGRGFEVLDDTTSNPVVIVTQAAADRFWPGESPLGRTIRSYFNPENSWTVVGVTEDTKIWSLTEAPRPYLYFPVYQSGSPSIVFFVARGQGEPAALVRDLDQAVRSVDPDLFVVERKTMGEHLRYILFLPQLGAVLVSAFALLAMTLASVGLFGIVNYGVARRTKELGIRISLGAQQQQIINLVMRSGLSSVAIGAAIGLVGAVVTARVLERFLIGVSGWDPLTFAVVPLVLGGLSLLAAYLPARRANRVDPIEALRME